MSCIECNGNFNNCPVCSDTPDTTWEECPKCHGHGMHFFDDCGNTRNFDEWVILPRDERMEDDCDQCGGRGEIML